MSSESGSLNLLDLDEDFGSILGPSNSGNMESTLFDIGAYSFMENTDNETTTSPTPSPANPVRVLPETDTGNSYFQGQGENADAWINSIPDADLLNPSYQTDKKISLFSTLSQVPASESFVAPMAIFSSGAAGEVKSEPLDIPTLPLPRSPAVPAKRGRGRRKQPQTVRNCLSPLAPTQLTENMPSTSTGRKRHHSFDFDESPATPGGTRRIKMHELNPEMCPNAKNARAAYLNREKKKKAFTELEEENEANKSRINQLQQMLNRTQFEKEEMRMERDVAVQKTQAIMGLQNQTQNIRDFLVAITPGLTTSHGEFKIGFANVFTEAPVTGTADSNNAQLAVYSGGKPSDFFTLHVNMDERKLDFDYSPRTGKM